MSGSMERTSSIGRLSLTCSGFDEPLPRRYAIAMCPTANKASFPASFSDSSVCLAIKHIGYGQV